ncbi:MAG: biotin/lipoyl-binding protein [Pseudomonadota bacterium]
MIAFLTLAYVAVLFVLIKMKIVPNSAMTWLTTIVWIVVLFIFLFIPMQWGAPSGPVRVMTRAVQIVPNISGQVTEIAVSPNVPLKQGDLLFQVDPEPFQIAVDLASASKIRVETQVKQDQDALVAAQAQLRRAEANRDLAQSQFDDDKQLVDRGVIAENRLETRQANLDSAESVVEEVEATISKLETEIGAVTADGVVAKVAEASSQLEQAIWNLEQTSVLAPSDGYVTNLALSVGQRVTNLPLAPAMVFVDTSEKVIVAEINQNQLRYVKPDQLAEIAFKAEPGRVVSAKVETVLQIASQGQAIVSGNLLTAGSIQAEPFMIRIVLDNPEDDAVMTPGNAGTVAIYTESVAFTHVIRKVMIRMEAIMNYIIPGL